MTREACDPLTSWSKGGIVEPSIDPNGNRQPVASRGQCNECERVVGDGLEMVNMKPEFMLFSEM